jgi:hypothetical protein
MSAARTSWRSSTKPGRRSCKLASRREAGCARICLGASAKTFVIPQLPEFLAQHPLLRLELGMGCGGCSCWRRALIAVNDHEPHMAAGLNEAIAHAHEACEIRDPHSLNVFSRYCAVATRLYRYPRFREVILRMGPGD